jgi:hypothetical protein
MIRFFTLVVSAAALLIALIVLVPEFNTFLDESDLDPRWFLFGAGLAGLCALLSTAFALVDKWDLERQKRNAGKR